MTITQIVDDLRAKCDMHKKAIEIMEDTFAAAVGMHGDRRSCVQCYEESHRYVLRITLSSLLPRIYVYLSKMALYNNNEPALVDIRVAYEGTSSGINLSFTTFEQAIERVGEILHTFRMEDESVFIKKSPAARQDDSGNPPQVIRVEYVVNPIQTISGTP